MIRQKPVIKQAKTTKFEQKNFENIGEFSWSSESSIEKKLMSAGTQINEIEAIAKIKSSSSIQASLIDLTEVS